MTIKHLLPFILAFILMNYSIQAQTTDTIKVKTHNAVDMTWYGSYDRTTQFPGDTITFSKILLHYTMGCASGGCSAWDYTTKIEIIKKTGIYDSTQVNLPSFTLDGNAPDSLHLSFSETYHLVYNSVNNTIDTIFNPQLTVITYNNTQNPSLPLDTLNVWEANYYIYVYDAGFNIVDSILVQADTVLYQNIITYYNVFEITEPFELARVITPYGNYMTNGSNGFNNSWKHKHTFDVTDFAPLLKDSVIIRAFYDGWSSGFSATLEFDMIMGTPPRNVLDIKNVYKGSASYSNSAQFESTYLIPRTVFIPAQVAGAKLRVIPTGHGFDNNVYCAEFCPRNYYVKIGIDTTFTQSIWRDDCGLNPVYPQGGTWLYDRANWCPGSRAHIFEHNITPWLVPNDSLHIDIDLQNYTWTGNQAPSYYFSTQLITYSTFNVNTDAGIEDIMTPTKADDHKRYNPVCKQAKIKVRNYGATTINNIEIAYNIKGNAPQTYLWTGNLNSNESEIITLPNLNSWNGSENIFESHITSVNGSTDNNPFNDYLSAAFDTVPVYASENIVLELKTNSMGHHTSWTMEDVNGNVLYSGSNYGNNVVVKDTMYLPEGCYVFKINDSGKNGLAFWANNEGSGYVRLKKLTTGYFKIFNPDFGTQIMHHFRTAQQTSISKQNMQAPQISVFPNPCKEVLYIDIDEQASQAAFIELYDITGSIVLEGTYNSLSSNGLLQLTNIKKGCYQLLIKTPHHVFRQKVVVL